MKKIIIFSTAYLPLQGGAEVAIKEITDRISRAEFDLICARLKRNFPRKETISNVNVHRIGFGNRFDKVLLPFLGFLKARRIIKKNQFKIQNSKFKIILWGMMASWGSLAALLFKNIYPKFPLLLTLQEGDAEVYIKKGRMGMIGLTWRWLLKRADYVQVISKYLADMARKYGYQGKIEIVPNGVDLQKFKITSQNSKVEINKYNKIIITVSRLVGKNGIVDLIEAIKLLITKYQFPVKLLILGSGPLEKNLKLKAKKLGLGNKVIFLGDVANEKVPGYLAASDVFCRPSLSEGLGNSFLEAMAVGVPVVATRVGGIPDFITDNETGLFCEMKNPGSIAEKINLLLEDSNLRQKLIANGRKIVEEKYDWNKIAEKINSIFEKICAF